MQLSRVCNLELIHGSKSMNRHLDDISPFFLLLDFESKNSPKSGKKYPKRTTTASTAQLHYQGVVA